MVVGGGASWLPASFQQQHCSMSICPLPGKQREHARQHGPQEPPSSPSHFKDSLRFRQQNVPLARSDASRTRTFRSKRSEPGVAAATRDQTSGAIARHQLHDEMVAADAFKEIKADQIRKAPPERSRVPAWLFVLWTQRIRCCCRGHSRTRPGSGSAPGPRGRAPPPALGNMRCVRGCSPQPLVQVQCVDNHSSMDPQINTAKYQNQNQPSSLKDGWRTPLSAPPVRAQITGGGGLPGAIFLEVDKQLLIVCLNMLEDADESADMSHYFRFCWARRPGSVWRKLSRAVVRWGGGGRHTQRGILAESFSQNAT